MYSIYTLIDPRDDAIRYVGLTNDVYARFSQHLRCDSSNISKNAWIQELKDANQMLIMRTIDSVETFEQARERERYWIKHHMKQGCSLLNIDGAKSITFGQFMAFFGEQEDRKAEVEEEAEIVEREDVPVSITQRQTTRKRQSTKGDAVKRVERILKRTPDITPTELAKRAKISKSYASEVRKKLQPKESA